MSRRCLSGFLLVAARMWCRRMAPAPKGTGIRLPRFSPLLPGSSVVDGLNINRLNPDAGQGGMAAEGFEIRPCDGETERLRGLCFEDLFFDEEAYIDPGFAVLIVDGFAEEFDKLGCFIVGVEDEVDPLNQFRD